MEKRSRRRTRDLVTQLASQGLSENEIGCERISIMARSTNAPFTGRIQKRKTYPLHYSHPACNARPVHTDGSEALIWASWPHVAFTPGSDQTVTRPDGRKVPKGGTGGGTWALAEAHAAQLRGAAKRLEGGSRTTWPCRPRNVCTLLRAKNLTAEAHFASAEFWRTTTDEHRVFYS
jgi:hypothetical protein